MYITLVQLSNFSKDGYDISGYNEKGFNRAGTYKNGTRYNTDGYDKEGFDKYGYDKDGYDISGYDKRGYDSHGYNKKGFNKANIHRNGTIYDELGYDVEGYNSSGLNKCGLTKVEQQKKSENQRRANYLGLLRKVKKLSSGEMTLEAYVKSSKTSIRELIEFAKKQEMDAQIVRGLYKYVREYDEYTKSFSKKSYLEGTVLFINGREVRPTEDDVDKCIEYLKSKGSLIYKKGVENTIRKYLKGELSISC